MNTPASQLPNSTNTTTNNSSSEAAGSKALLALTKEPENTTTSNSPSSSLTPISENWDKLVSNKLTEQQKRSNSPKMPTISNQTPNGELLSVLYQHLGTALLTNQSSPPSKNQKSSNVVSPDSAFSEKERHNNTTSKKRKSSPPSNNSIQSLLDNSYNLSTNLGTTLANCGNSLNSSLLSNTSLLNSNSLTSSLLNNNFNHHLPQLNLNPPKSIKNNNSSQNNNSSNNNSANSHDSVNNPPLSHPAINRQAIQPANKPFSYVMDAPKSLKQADNTPPMSYINKGQFYCINLSCTDSSILKSTKRVKSIISIVFGSKTAEEQLKHWRYWHARQHITKQRIIDIADYKESNMLREIQEFSHNAISFVWNSEIDAKIFISANCLSTDFSAQKGIKGMALNLQIDSYVETDDNNWKCCHRGTSQIKIFCDKGAERKIRDEERKCRQEALSQNPGVNVSEIKRQEKVAFMTMNEFESVEEPPFYFKPELSSGRALPSSQSSCNNNENVENSPPSSKRARLTENTSPIPTSPYANSPPTASITSNGLTPSPPLPKIASAPVEKPVLLYVREEDEEVFDGVMLPKPTKTALLTSLGEKYGVQVDKVRKFYKRSKKGILVKIDDNIIKHYSHEDTFCIKCSEESDGTIKVVLTEVEN